MEYKDRLTKRTYHKENDFYVYTSNREILEVYRQLGYYEDTGCSPVEVIDALLNCELSKDRNNWDMDKIEKLQLLKMRIE